jgi:O-antigen ligase
MMRWLLFLLFVLLLLGDTMGLNVGLAPGLSTKNAFLYLVSLGIAIDAAIHRNRHIELLSVIAPYALCIFYALFTWLVIVLILDYPGYNAFGTLITLKGGVADHLLMLLVFFYGVLNSRDALWLMKAMIWTVVAASAVGVVDFMGLLDLGLMDELKGGRLGGPIGEANQYAAFLALFLPASVALAVIERGLRRNLAVMGVLATVIAILLTGSRGGIAGVLGGTVLGLVFLRAFVSARVVIPAIAGFVALIALSLAAVFAAGYWDLLYDRFVGETVGAASAFDASAGRTVIWGWALAKMASSPITLLTGFGWDSYRYFPDFGFAPHNGYLKIYFELGMVGVFLVLLALGNTLRIARNGLRMASEPEVTPLMIGAMFGIFGIMVATFFVDISAPWLFLWAVSGVTARLALLQEDASLSSAASVGPAPRGMGEFGVGRAT